MGMILQGGAAKQKTSSITHRKGLPLNYLYLSLYSFHDNDDRFHEKSICGL
jgi:hypothetical protein